jgi:hypothetical protein
MKLKLTNQKPLKLSRWRDSIRIVVGERNYMCSNFFFPCVHYLGPWIVKLSPHCIGIEDEALVQPDIPLM